MASALPVLDRSGHWMCLTRKGSLIRSPREVDCGQELQACFGPIPKHSEHAARHHGGCRLMQPPACHAAMGSFNDKGDALRCQHTVQRVAICTVIRSGICGRFAWESTRRANLEMQTTLFGGR